MPKVSVVTPCFNCGPYVERCVRSVIAQTFTDWEHVVVDDGSTDDSAAVVAALLPAEPRLRLLRQANGGCLNARKRGYRECDPDGEYVLFFDADDCLEPRMLEVLVRYLDAHPRVGVAFCDYVRIDEQDVPRPPEPRGERFVPSRFWVRALRPDEPDTPLVSVYNFAPVFEGLALMRRSVFDQTSGWEESLGQGQEGVVQFLHMVLRAEIHFVPEVLYRYRRRPGQMSANRDRMRAQVRKVFQHWAALSGLTEAQRAALDAARRFRERRLLPYCAWQDCGRHLRAGRPVRAAQALARALWRHARSLVVDSGA
jgi:glycosyltransferase involved in cell wall biosynthesis